MTITLLCIIVLVSVLMHFLTTTARVFQQLSEIVRIILPMFFSVKIQPNSGSWEVQCYEYINKGVWMTDNDEIIFYCLQIEKFFSLYNKSFFWIRSKPNGHLKCWELDPGHHWYLWILFITFQYSSEQDMRYTYVLT